MSDNNGNGNGNVESAEHVEHADTVAVADNVDTVNLDPNRLAKRWFWPILFATVALLGGTLVLASTVLLTIQRADKAERAVIKAERAVTEVAAVNQVQQERDVCYDRYVALVNDRNLEAKVALDRLVIEITRSDTGERTQQRAAAIDNLEAADDAVVEAVEMRADYIAADQPLPCPLDSTLQPAD